MSIQKRDIRVLVSADINGRFEQVIPKVTQLHSKNNFDFMLLLGQVCHPRASPFISSIAQKNNSLPLPLSFIDRSDFSPVLLKLHPEGKEIVPRFNFLGRNGLTQVQGLNIAFFSGYDENKGAIQFQTEIEQFLSVCQNKDIDILMTNQWPEQIKMISEKTSPKTAKYVSIIANHLSPRYHFAAGSDSFYRLSPYRNAKGRLTHFISVAPCLEELKDKYLFAITIKPNTYEAAPENNSTCLQNPFLKNESCQMPQNSNLTIQLRMAQQKEKKAQHPKGRIVIFFQGFPDWARKEDISEFLERWGQIKHLQSFKDKRGNRSGTVRFSEESVTQQCLKDSGKFMFHTSRIKFQARNIQDRQRVEDCWFCKTNTDKSLIIWEGRYVYLCLEKGPLCRFHLQIIPYNHTQSSTRLDPQEQQQLNKVKQRLISHFSDDGFQVIIYQRCLPLSEAVNHCVIHLLPIKRPQSLARNFQQINKNDLLGFKQWAKNKRGSQYFLNLQIGSKTYIKEIQRREKVQADFMRQLLCQLLQTPKLVNWKMCERKPQQLIAELQASIEQVKKAGLSS